MWQLNILFGVYAVNFLWSAFTNEFKHKIRMVHSFLNDIAGMVLTWMHYIFITPNITDF